MSPRSRRLCRPAHEDFRPVLRIAARLDLASCQRATRDGPECALQACGGSSSRNLLGNVMATHPLRQHNG
nr:hypothetical protein JVH1_8734 [Rhodococcus sp. JVH1]